jgi:cation-transporting ATPase E
MAVLTISPVTLLTYLYTLRLTEAPDLARTVLTTTATFCGLMLLPFVEPPSQAWVSGDRLSGDWRPTILGVLLLVIFVSLLWLPSTREAFEFTRLSIGGLIAIASVVLVWAWGLRWLWRQRALERFLGLPAGGFLDGDG